MIAASVVFAPVSGACAEEPADPSLAVLQAESTLGIADGAGSAAIHEVGQGTAQSVGDGSTSVAITPGTTVRERLNASAATYTMQRVDEETTRFAAVVNYPSERATWTFPSDVILQPLSDGRVVVTNENGDFIAGIDAPWAVDASGIEVPTYYDVDGTTLTQTIETSKATPYPVVADPTVRTYISYYTVALNRAESTTAISTVAACTALFSKSPVPAMKALTIGCGVFAAYSTPQLAGGKCMTIHVAGIPPVLGTWWPTFPKC